MVTKAEQAKLDAEKEAESNENEARSNENADGDGKTSARDRVYGRPESNDPNLGRGDGESAASIAARAGLDTPADQAARAGTVIGTSPRPRMEVDAEVEEEVQGDVQRRMAPAPRSDAGTGVDGFIGNMTREAYFTRAAEEKMGTFRSWSAQENRDYERAAEIEDMRRYTNPDRV